MLEVDMKMMKLNQLILLIEIIVVAFHHAHFHSYQYIAFFLILALKGIIGIE